MLPEVLLLIPGFLFLKALFPPLLLMSCLLKIKKLFRYLSNRTTISHLHGLPWWLNIKKKICLPRQEIQETCVQSPGPGRFPWRWQWQPTLVLLPRKSHGQSNLMGYTVHGVTEGRTWLSDSTTTKSPPYKWLPFWECRRLSPICSSKSNKVSLDTQLTQLVILCYWAQYSVL